MIGESARVQTATLWVSSSADSAGEEQYDAPTTISVRWEQREQEFRDEKGGTRRASHVVYLGRDTKIGDYMYLGTSVQADPRDEEDALRVQDFRKIPSIDASDFEQRALL